MQLTRRSMIAAFAGFGTAPALSGLASGEAGTRSTLGLVIHSFAVRTARDRARPSGERFSDPARFLDHAHGQGAGGVQVGLGNQSDAAAGSLRDRAGALSMYLEGIISLPRADSDLARFEAEVRTA